jgi:hypothetical protein
MTAETPPRRVSSAGAWLGFATAAWSAVVAWTGVALLAAVAALPSVVAQAGREAERQSGSADFPPSITLRIDLLEEVWTIVRRFAHAAGVAGLLLGLALFVAGWTLLAGREFGRRAARTLLAATAAYLVGAAAWIVALAPRLADWNDRWRRAHEGFADAARDRLPPDFGPWASSVATGLAVGAAAGLLIVAALFLATGRPAARDWCAERRKSPVASLPGPR